MFNAIVKTKFNGDIKFLKYRNVKNINALLKYIEGKGYSIEYLNLYSTKTREKIYAANGHYLKHNDVQL
jgi:hypothetical protein